MSIILGIATAVIGALFWSNRRRRYTYPVVVSHYDRNSDVREYCDDDCDDAETFCEADDYRDDDRGSSSDYGRSSARDD
jgi:hypothetical protein